MPPHIRLFPTGKSWRGRVAPGPIPSGGRRPARTAFKPRGSARLQSFVYSFTLFRKFYIQGIPWNMYRYI